MTLTTRRQFLRDAAFTSIAASTLPRLSAAERQETVSFFLVGETHVGKSGRPVVLVHHVDVHRYSETVADEKVKHSEWDYGDAQAFHAALKPYRVAATMCGHTHTRKIARWNGTQDDRVTEGVPFLNTDNAAHFHNTAQAILHIEIAAQEMRVREFGTKDVWQTGAWTPQVWRFPLSV